MNSWLSKFRTPIIYGIFLLWMFWVFGIQSIGKRLLLQVNGTVVSSHDIPHRGAPRYITEYIIRGIDGVDHPYIAGPTDASLERSMPVGTKITKYRWEYGYELNGYLIKDVNTFVGDIAIPILFALFLFWQLRIGGKKSKNQV